MLEDRLRGVVTVDVREAQDIPRAFFGVAGTAAPPPKSVDPYRGSLQILHGQISGSGFVIRKNNVLYVVTNCHVISTAAEGEPDDIVVVSLTGERYPMTLVGADTLRDVAVLKFKERPGNELKAMSFRASNVRIGERVFALGNPVGRFPSSVTEGIISGMNRLAGTSAGYLQSSAAISPGNSGGPLIDTIGQVVGLNTAHDRDAKLVHFALNGALAQDTVNEIILNGRVRRGSLGLQIAAVNMLGSTSFAIMRALGPAKTQLEGTVLLKVNGVPPQHRLELFAMLDQVKPGQEVKLNVEGDDNKLREVKVTATELTEQRLNDVVGPFVRDILGLQVDQGKNAVTVKPIATERCERKVFRKKSGEEEAEAVSKLPEVVDVLAAGWNADDDELLYPTPSVRAFHLVVRRLAVDGRLLTVSRSGEDTVDMIAFAPHTGVIPLAVILH